ACPLHSRLQVGCPPLRIGCLYLDHVTERVLRLLYDAAPDHGVAWRFLWERTHPVSEIDQSIWLQVHSLDLIEDRNEACAATTWRSLMTNVVQIAGIFELVHPLHRGVAPHEHHALGPQILKDARYLGEEHIKLLLPDGA